MVLYRLTQEAFTNVARHARASRVELRLEVRADRAALTITDDGVGFDVERLRRAPAAGGVGLVGMRERVAHYHGALDIRSRLRGGTRVSVSIPLDPPGHNGARAPGADRRADDQDASVPAERATAQVPRLPT